MGPARSGPEEFPDFVAFWFTRAESANSPFDCYALLDGPSVTGAYRIAMERTKGVVMEIEATLFFRKPVDRLGLAPPGHWRAEFDFVVEGGHDPVEMRLFLRTADQVLTETWLYQYHPFQTGRARPS